MAEDPKLKEAKKLLEQIQKVYDELGKTNPFRGIDPDTIAASNKEIEKLKIALTGITKKADDLEAGFGGIAASIGASLAEMNKQSSATNRTVKAMRGLSSISESLKNDQSGLVELSLKELENKRDKAKILSEEAKSQAALVKQKYSEITLGKNGKQIHGAALTKRLKKQGISKSELQTIQEIIAAEKKEFDVLDELNAKIEERIQKEKKVNRTLGLTKVALEGLGKIPIVGPLLKTNEALDAARTKAKKGENALQSLGAAMGSMGKSLLSNLTDPLVVIGLLVKGFQTFLELGFAVDKQVTDLSKSMAVSHEEATATRDRFKQIAEEVATSANQSERLVINQHSLSEAQLELAKAFGVTRGFTDQQVKDQVILTKLMGLTGEESKGIQQLAIANGMKVREVTGSIIKQTSALVKQTGIQLDNKEILQDVAKVSGQLRLQYANNPDLIAKAVIQTKLLGISLETAANAAKGLLQFEDSIENELSAELLTGKALNLERARGLALNGKSIEAAAEMLSQVGSSADFINMNVIQQEAIAKAIGMGADELANSLVAQENIANLSANTREQVEQALKKAVTEEEKQRILAKLGNEEDAKAALEKLNAQETLNNAIDQMKKLLGAIFEGPAKGFVNLIAELAGDMPRLMGYFYKLKSILISLADLSLAKMAFNVASSATAVLGPVAGIAAGVGAYMWGKSLMPSFEDGGVVSGPTMGLIGEYPGAKSNPEVIAPLDKLKKIIRDDKDKDNNKGGMLGLIETLVNANNKQAKTLELLVNRPILVSTQIDNKELILSSLKNPETRGIVNTSDTYAMGSGPNPNTPI